jgi:hypothetical protein
MHIEINTKRPVRISEDGQTVFVTLKCGSTAVIDRDDFDRLAEDGISFNWFIITNGQGNTYVGTHHTRLGNIVTVSRQIMRAKRGEVIYYLSGDRFDLRKSNLRRRGGPSKRSLRG